VQHYRTRRKSSGAESLALDFDSAADGSRAAESDRTPAWDGAAVSSHDRESDESQGAFDTNYYRRLNAQAIEQSATAAAGGEVNEVDVETACAFGLGMGAGAMDDYETMPGINCSAYGDGDTLHQSAYGLEAQCEWTEVAGNSAQQAAPNDYCAQDAPAEPHYGAMYEQPSQIAAAPPQAGVQTNVIVFPRPLLEPPLVPQPSRDELADPVSARPRILEVPEEIIPAVQESLFPEIRLDADEAENFERREPEIEVPLPVAPVSVRLTAGLADVAVVLAAVGLFAAIADRALPDVPHAKPYWMGIGAVAVLFWAVYQNLFLLYSGRTIGMAMNKIHLSTFDGRTPQWHERRHRAIFTVISFVSVALGFFWAFVDIDTLCWHDRVSQTFPTED
jgi:uncharacterized RDD family membrane protein YckC